MTGKRHRPWAIPSRGRSCVRGGEPLTAGMEIFSVLSTDDHGGFCRSDYCVACWALASPTRVLEGATYWRAVLPERQQVEQGAIAERSEQVLDWLREALARGDGIGARQAYVLALYLVRLRKLVRRQNVTRDGTPFTLYEVVDGEEAMLVPMVTFSRAEADELHRDLADRLRYLVEQSGSTAIWIVERCESHASGSGNVGSDR